MSSLPPRRTVAEFFAGIGLMRLGLERAGWETIWANDIDPEKQKMYAEHFADSAKQVVLGGRAFPRPAAQNRIVMYALNKKEQQIAAGLFLSKFDVDGLRALGISTFTEAFNTLGFALGGRPASVKNYRDEFDPMYPNSRQGWRNRPTREHCLAVRARLDELTLDDFAGMLRSCIGQIPPAGDDAPQSDASEEEQTSGRALTGAAAERYFEQNFRSVAEFAPCTLQNTSLWGCGHDFRLRSSASDYLAVEVKGLSGKSGAISMTEREYRSATKLGDRYYLFVAMNFRESPCHKVYRNPLSSGLKLQRTERTVTQVSWSASV